MQKEEIGNDSSHACVRFRLGEEGFGIPLSQVGEIAPVERITTVPMAPAAVRGLVCLRGHIVTLIDVATIFERDLPQARGSQDRLMVILAEPYQHLGLYVHAPVEIGRMAMQSPLPASTPLAMVAAIDSGGSSRPDRGARDTDRVDDAAPGGVLHLLSTREIVAWCDARVIEGFRRRN